MEAPCQISVSTDSQSEVCLTSASQSDSSTTLTSQSGSSMATPTDEKMEPLQLYTEQLTSEELLTQYQSLVNQHAQAAALNMLLCPSTSLTANNLHCGGITDTLNGVRTTDPVGLHQLMGNAITTYNNNNNKTAEYSINSHTNGHTGETTLLRQLESGQSTDITPSVAAVLANTRRQCNTNSKSVPKRSGAKDRPADKYKCRLCSYTSRWSHGLTNHMRTHNDTVFKCDQCDYSTPWKGDLTNHQRRHNGNLFQCTECDYTSIKKQGLQKHLRMHTGAKPFKCTECSYESSQPGNLKKHMMRHTGEKPIACKLCDYRCRQRQQLSIHMHQYHTTANQSTENNSSSANQNSLVTANQEVLPTVSANHNQDRAAVSANQNIESAASANQVSVSASVRTATRNSNKTDAWVKKSSPQQYTCEPCGFCWRSKLSYLKHMRATHGLKKTSSSQNQMNTAAVKINTATVKINTSAVNTISSPDTPPHSGTNQLPITTNTQLINNTSPRVTHRDSSQHGGYTTNTQLVDNIREQHLPSTNFTDNIINETSVSQCSTVDFATSTHSGPSDKPSTFSTNNTSPALNYGFNTTDVTTTQSNILPISTTHVTTRQISHECIVTDSLLQSPVIGADSRFVCGYVCTASFSTERDMISHRATHHVSTGLKGYKWMPSVHASTREIGTDTLSDDIQYTTTR